MEQRKKVNKEIKLCPKCYFRPISEKSAEYSKKVYGEELCYSCQKKYGKRITNS